jgi:serine/threonine protein kinase
MREQHGPLKEQHAFSANGQGSQAQQQEQRFFGNYELVRRIDEGGMGEVYLARQRTAFEREVAVKIIRADLMHDTMVRQRFLREAEVNAHLKHEHILPLIEFNEDQGRLFLVTPYIDGGTLAQRLQRGPMAMAEVHQLFSALVRAVSYIHKRGVVHRDLKPGNVLLDRDENDEQVYVRLIDFGIASIQGTATASPELTQAGRELGTIEYMAPERLGGIAAPSNDIFSLGVILYQMLTGRLPNEGEIIPLPSPMAYVVNHCTYADPTQRFPNADELLRVFEQAYQAVITPKSTSVAVVPIEAKEGATHLPAVPRPGENITRESKPLDAVMGAATPRPTNGFTGNDYNAPTSFIEPSRFAERNRQVVANPSVNGANITKPIAARRKKGSIFAFLSFAIVALLVVISLLGYYAFLGAITATVSLSPQIHSLTKVLTITAKPALHNTDTGAASVPAYVLNSTQSGSKESGTTGKECILGVFDCKRVVAFSDVDPLATQLSQTLRVQVQNDLKSKAQAANATVVGSIVYTDGAPTPTPDVGSVSDTVTVTMKEQGAVEYFKTTEVQSLARILLTHQAQQQFGTGYVLLNSSTQIGQPAIQSVDTNGNVTLQIAVGGVVQYSINAQQLATLQNHIKGTKQKDARIYLAQQSGIDTNSIAIHISYSDTLPSDIHQIKIVQVTPSTLPNVQLPTVKATLAPTF